MIISNALTAADLIQLAKVGTERLADSVIRPLEILEDHAEQWEGRGGSPDSVFDLLRRESMSVRQQAELLGISEDEASELRRWISQQPFTPQFIARFGYLLRDPEKFVALYAAHGLGVLAAEEYVHDPVPIDSKHMYRCQCPKNCGALLGVDPMPGAAFLLQSSEPDLKLGFDRPVDHFVTTRSRMWKILLGEPQ